MEQVHHPAPQGAAPQGAAPQGAASVRIRTPSGKTALLYPGALGAGGAPAAAALAALGLAGTAATGPRPGSGAQHSASGGAPPEQGPSGGAPPALAREAAGAAEEAEEAADADAADAFLEEENDDDEDEEEQELAAEDEVHIAAPPNAVPSAAAGPGFTVGEIVYRHGELATVVHVDYGLQPPDYVVRMAQAGHEVNCEGRHLVPAFGCSPSQADHPCAPVALAPPEPFAMAFADIVQQQRAQSLQSGHDAHCSHKDQPGRFQNAVSMQELQHLQAMQQLQMVQAPQGLQMMQAAPVPQAQPQFWTFEQYPMELPPPSADHLQLYDALQAQALSDVVGGQSYHVKPTQLQHCHVLQAQAQAEPCAFPPPADDGAVSASGSKNHALEAVTEALDRAEVNMLTCGRKQPGRKQSAGFAMQKFNGFGDFPPVLASRGCAANFALQAASEALGASGIPTSIDAKHQPWVRSESGMANLFSDEPAAAPAVRGRHTVHGGERPVRGIELLEHDGAGGFGAVFANSAPYHGLAVDVDCGPQGPTAASSQKHREEPPLDLLRSTEPEQQEKVDADRVSVGHDFGTRAPTAQQGLVKMPAYDLLGMGDFNPSPGPLDEDDELEFMARREMDEDATVDLSSRPWPPRPPAVSAESARPLAALAAAFGPPSHLVGALAPPALPPGPAHVAVAVGRKQGPRRSSSRPRPEVSEQQRVERRNLLVDCILSDGPGPVPGRRAPTPRAPTPRAATPRAVTPRGGRERDLSRGPPTARPRSGSCGLVRERPREPAAEPLVGPPAAPPGASERLATPRLPQLEVSKHQLSGRTLPELGPPTSARSCSWRGTGVVGSAAAGLYG